MMKKKKKKLPIRPPVELQFEPTIPIEKINAAVDKAIKEYFRDKRDDDHR